MGRDNYDSKYVNIVEVAAGDAANTAGTSYYVDTRKCKRGNLQLNWTAGSGGGTIAVTAFGCMFPHSNEDAAKAADSGDMFQDVGTAYLGAASLTADAMIEDYNGIAGSYQFMKFVVVITNKDASTAYRLGQWQTE